MHYMEITACRACSSKDLPVVFSLGTQQVVDFVEHYSDSKKVDDAAPLMLMMCRNCSLVQLKYSVNPDRLYKKFWYRSSGNEAMVAALASITERVNALAHLQAGDWVLDIGANDGVLLNTYEVNGLNTVGVDPAENIDKVPAKHNRVWVQDFFSAGAVNSVVGNGKYRAITAIAMFYDLEDPMKFLQDCREVLADDGLLVIQMNYLGAMLKNMAFDNICHEHLTYFSLSSLWPLVRRSGLEIVGATENDVNGGSLRVYITHPGAELPGFGIGHKDFWGSVGRLHNIAKAESDGHLDDPLTFLRWGKAISETVIRVRSIVSKLKNEGHRVALYGASTRGSTLMQTLYPLEDGRAPFPFAAERDERKVGLTTAGYRVRIVSEEVGRKLADYFLVLPWHYRESILQREKQWLMDGGKFIFPLPTLEVVGKEVFEQKSKEVSG